MTVPPGPGAIVIGIAAPGIDAIGISVMIGPWEQGTNASCGYATGAGPFR
jgi:hypothetical protein